MENSPLPRTARARLRNETTEEIKSAGRRQLAGTGPAGLSLRAVARDVGLVSSAVYRYFASRDELLTALIVDAFASVGEAAERAESAIRRSDLSGRWLAIARAVREWAVANPQEYALVFGSPVPGYRAPTDTVDPAARVPGLILSLVEDASAGGPDWPGFSIPMPRTVRADMKALALGERTPGQRTPGPTEARLARGAMAWTQLIGSVSFELFGHLHNVIDDYPAYFDYQMRTVARELGLTRSD